MRDLIVVAIILGSVPFCFASPYFGVLMWYWVSYFNPHRFTWSFAYNFPVAFVVAVPTVAGTLFARKSLAALRSRESILLGCLWAWFTITYLYAQNIPFFALHMDDAKYEMSHVSKIFVMTFVMIVVITSQAKLRGVMLVSAGSLGLLAIKGTIFGIRNAGDSRVWGPPDSFLADNNAFGLALNMAIPILFFMARHEENRWIRRFLYLCFLCAVMSVLLTYSRGGLLGLLVVLLAIVMKSRHKIVAAVLLLVVALSVVSVAPGAWWDRMDRIAHGKLDSSANQRLVSWGTAWHFSHDYPITGGGFDTLPDVNVFQRYQLRPLPEGFKSSGPHSIYFQLLADHGFVGLGIFLAMIASCFVSLWRIRRSVRYLPSLRWLGDYSYMIQVAIMAFLTSGAFLGFAYLDVIYQMIATVIVMKVLFRNEMEAHLVELEKGLAPVQREDMTLAT